MTRHRLEWSAERGNRRFEIAILPFNWTFGIYYENSIQQFVVLIGPLTLSCERKIDSGKFWPSGTIFCWHFRQWEIRFDWSLHQFLVGYSRAAWHDQGIYLGPIDIQIEYHYWQAS